MRKFFLHIDLRQVVMGSSPTVQVLIQEGGYLEGDSVIIFSTWKDTSDLNQSQSYQFVSSSR